MKLIVSGYGGKQVPSIGIFNEKENNDFDCIWNSTVEASSFLSTADNLIFGISELNDGGAVHMFGKTEKGYELVDTRFIPGNALCHISFLPVNRLLVGACYGSGEVFSIKVEKNGFGEMASYIRQGDEGKQITRAHCLVSSDERILFSANIALDRIYSYKLSEGKLIDNGYLSLPTGVGPRHILIRETLMYIITEYSNEIYSVQLADDKMKILGSARTLPDDFSGKSYCSTLCATEDGKYLYAANRGANTVTIFQVSKEGKLIKIGNNSCYGIWPRHIALINKDKYLAIANQESNEVVLCNRDTETGQLTGKIASLPFDRPSFVCEII